jgi:hypothetical protein
MYKFCVDSGFILSAVADYDVPLISKDKRCVLMNEDLDYKISLFLLKNGKIYRQHIIFDDGVIAVQSKLVYSF